MEPELKFTYKFTHYRVNPFMPQPTKGEPKLSCLVPNRIIAQMKKDYKHLKLCVPAHGGATVCSVYDSYGRHVADGKAVCSHSDVFSPKIGRELALFRAMVTARESVNTAYNSFLSNISNIVSTQCPPQEKGNG